MLLMLRLGRPAILPLDDLGIHEGYAVAFRKCVRRVQLADCMKNSVFSEIEKT